MIDYEWTNRQLTPQQIISRALNCYAPRRIRFGWRHRIVKKHLASPSAPAKSRCGSFRKKSWRSNTLSCRKRTGGAGRLLGSFGIDRQPCCAVSGIFLPGRRLQKGAGISKTSAQDIHRSILIISMDAYEADDLIERQDHLQSRYKSDSLRSCGAAVSGTDSWNRMARKSADAGTAGSVPVDERTGACRYLVPCSDGTV